MPTKGHLVKAMVFPVVLYGCESWIIKKAEHRRIDAFELWCWRRLLRVPWTARRTNQSILKEISPGVPCGQKVKRKKKPFWTSFIRLKAENSEPLYYLPQIPFAEMHPQRPHSMSSPHIYLPSVWHPWKLKTFSFVLSPLHKCIGLC